jgi:hypothetical protein
VDAIAAAWPTLSVPNVPGGPAYLLPALPWLDLWLWVDSGRCLVATATCVATALGAATACNALHRRFPAEKHLVFASGAGAFWVLLVTLVVASPPDLPPEHSAYTAMGLEEALHWLGAVYALGLTLFVLDRGLERWFASRPSDPSPGGAPAPPRRPRAWVLASCALALGASWVALVWGPERVAPRRVTRLIEDLDGDPATRHAALLALKQDAVAMREAWPHVLPRLQDPEPVIRRLAAESLCKTTAAEPPVIEALLDHAAHERDASVVAACLNTAALLQRWR